MSYKSILVLSFAVLISSDIYSQDQDSADQDSNIERIDIVGRREKRASQGATGLNLSIHDTPQSIISIDREFLDAFALDDVTSTLRMVNGLSVESVETDRTSFISRGFEMKHMQIDGINIPFSWNLNGSLDTSIYESIEVIRGANGLLTGTGAPSGTVNLIRKRPKSELQASSRLTVNSYSGKRVEGDISTPITSDGSWAARVVGTLSNEKSWIDRYENDRTVLYGIIDGQLTENLTLTVGYIDQKSDSTNPLWGALPLIYADGGEIDYKVSASTSMDWTFWNTSYQTTFAELSYLLPADWELRAVVNQTKHRLDQEAIWFGGFPDRETGLGLSGWPGGYRNKSDTRELDLIATGAIPLMGREHSLLFGYNISKADFFDTNKIVPSDDPVWGSAPPFNKGYQGNEVVRPPFGPPVEVGNWSYELSRYYGSMRIDPSDQWKIILGFNQFETKSDGQAYGEPKDASESQFSPYAGLVWSAFANTNFYLSYSEIYQPQTQLDDQLQAIGPAKGLNYEIGAKTEFLNNKLLASLSLFRAEQQNYAEFLSWDEQSGVSFYKGSNFRSEGLEIDLIGHVTSDLKILAGFGHLYMKNDDGSKRSYLPRNTLKLLSTYTLSKRWSLGGSMRWQDEIYYVSNNSNNRITQDPYAILGLNAAYHMNQHLTVALVLDNLTNEKYFNSFYWADIYGWDQAYFGAPRNGKLTVSLNW